MGPKPYNSLPKFLCLKTDMKLDTWKERLNKFLSQIPVNPVTTRITSGLCNLHTCKSTNSLCTWIPFLSTDGRLTKFPGDATLSN